jgi:hypothetical protein
MTPFFCDNIVKETRVLSFKNKRFQQQADALYKAGKTVSSNVSQNESAKGSLR